MKIFGILQFFFFLFLSLYRAVTNTVVTQVRIVCMYGTVRSMRVRIFVNETEFIEYNFPHIYLEY